MEKVLHVSASPYSSAEFIISTIRLSSIVSKAIVSPFFESVVHILYLVKAPTTNPPAMHAMPMTILSLKFFFRDNANDSCALCNDNFNSFN